MGDLETRLQNKVSRMNKIIQILSMLDWQLAKSK